MDGASGNPFVFAFERMDRMQTRAAKSVATRPSTAQRATSYNAALAIERAYDNLHRIQAMLAYLQIVKQQVHGIAQFLGEAKHTYQQALGRHEAQDFEGAQEFACASACLASVIETMIARALRSDSTYPSIVPPPPKHIAASMESADLDAELDEVHALLSRIHWLLDRGTLPLEERTQVRRISSWSDTLFVQARQLQGSGPQEDAAEFLQAAQAAANAAEHVCRRWYAGHTPLAAEAGTLETRQA